MVFVILFLHKKHAFYAGIGSQIPSITPLGKDSAYYIHSKSHPYFHDVSFQSKTADPFLNTSPQNAFYDLASLTKPMVTALWFWTLESSQHLTRHDPLKTSLKRVMASEML